MRVSAACVPKEEMHVIDWLKAQNEDPVIRGGYQVDAVWERRNPLSIILVPWPPPQRDWDLSVGKSPLFWSMVSFT